MSTVEILDDSDPSGIEMRDLSGLIYRVHPRTVDAALLRGWSRYREPAPQAQEETRGAPAPTLEKIRAMASEVRAGLEAGQWKDRDALIGVLSGIVVQAEKLAQPPAPASPAGREVWWYCANCRGCRPATRVNGDLLCACGHVIASYLEAPADPEAGAPGTQRPSTIEAAAMLAKAIQAGAQEGAAGEVGAG